MKVVAENSEAELEARRKQEATDRAREQVVRALRELAANLLRVIRGAGKPWTLGQDAAEVVIAIEAYQEIAGPTLFADDIAAALRIQEHYRHLPSLSSREAERLDAEEQVVRGALQVVASKLLGQRTQEAAGDDEMHRGIREFGEIRAEAKREHLVAMRALKAPKARSKARARPSTKKPG
ncbi:hypothetical protein [Roseomonas sp. BN140053]|uniref:hypothetical protein n=1 Tax=Roseomonas sp. BN140053 TaxID=3391898 RepID=UPI0039EC9337